MTNPETMSYVWDPEALGLVVQGLVFAEYDETVHSIVEFTDSGEMPGDDDFVLPTENVDVLIRG